MYELVNTSLPNGLIAGAHGFATVAMTKGMPDPLRIRVEAYCAYAHRTSAHDASYARENPVNWFHAVLPQGDHVVGRTAPAEFDYTGRTNRLARTLVFGRNAMPPAGGARALLSERARLSEPWQGEARWLDEDRETEARLRREPAGVATDAPAWRRMFGDADGLRLARRLALLLAKNVRTDGRPIFFKTSAARDAGGMELLALFADLIDLLPPDIRPAVAFSTYSASWPNGSVCHLRGVYDRDRAFDAAAATRPWVDCESATVHNADSLPAEDDAMPGGGATPARAANTTTAAAEVFRTAGGSRAERRHAAPPPSARRTPMGRTENAARYLPKRKDGTKALLVGMIALCSLLTLAIAGAGVWFVRDSARKNEELKRQAEELKQRDAERQRAAAQEEAKRKEEETRRKEEARKEGERRKQQEEAERKAEIAKRQKAEAEAAKPKATLLRPRRNPEAALRLAFTNATSVVFGEVVNDRDVNDRDKERLTNGAMRVYWYDGKGSLTNCPGGFARRGGGALGGGFTQTPSKGDMDSMSKSSPFVLWYDMANRKVYWDWKLDKLEKVKVDGDGKTIGGKDEFSLRELCFGREAGTFETWKRLEKKNNPDLAVVQYDLECESTSGRPVVVSVTNDVLTWASLANAVLSRTEKKSAVSPGADARAAANENWTKCSRLCKEVEDNRKEFEKKCNEYAENSGRLKKLKKAKGKDRDAAAESSLNREMQKIENEIYNLLGVMMGRPVRERGIEQMGIGNFKKEWKAKLDKRQGDLQRDRSKAAEAREAMDGIAKQKESAEKAQERNLPRRFKVKRVEVRSPDVVGNGGKR